MPNALHEFNIVLTTDLYPRALVASEEELVLFNLEEHSYLRLRYSDILLLKDYIAEFTPEEGFVRVGYTVRYNRTENLASTLVELQRLAFYLDFGCESLILFSVDKQYIFDILSGRVRIYQYFYAPETSVHFMFRLYEEILDRDAVFDYCEDRNARYLNIGYAGYRMQFDYQTAKLRYKGASLTINRQYVLDFANDSAKNYFQAHFYAKQLLMRDYFENMNNVGSEATIYGATLEKVVSERNYRKFNHLLAELGKDYDIMQSRVQKDLPTCTFTHKQASLPRKRKSDNILIETVNLQVNYAAGAQHGNLELRDLAYEASESHSRSYSSGKAFYDSKGARNDAKHRQALELVTKALQVLQELYDTGVDAELLDPCLKEIYKVLSANPSQVDLRDFDYLFPLCDTPRVRKITEAFATIRLSAPKDVTQSDDSEMSTLPDEMEVDDGRRIFLVDMCVSLADDTDDEEEFERREVEEQAQENDKHEGNGEHEGKSKRKHGNVREIENKTEPAAKADVAAYERGSKSIISQQATTEKPFYRVGAAETPATAKHKKISILQYIEKRKRFYRCTFSYDTQLNATITSYQNETTKIKIAAISECTNFKPFSKLLEQGARAVRKKKTVNAAKPFEDIDGSIYTRLLQITTGNTKSFICVREADAKDLLAWATRV